MRGMEKKNRREQIDKVTMHPLLHPIPSVFARCLPGGSWWWWSLSRSVCLLVSLCLNVRENRKKPMIIMCPLSFSLSLSFSEPNVWHIYILQIALIKHSSNVIAHHPSSLPISHRWRGSKRAKEGEASRSSTLTKTNVTVGNFLRDFFSCFFLLFSLLERFRDDATSISSSGCSLLFFLFYISIKSIDVQCIDSIILSFN